MRQCVAVCGSVSQNGHLDRMCVAKQGLRPKPTDVETGIHSGEIKRAAGIGVAGLRYLAK